MSITKAVTILLLCLPTIAAAQESNNHKFLDKTNLVLFSTHAAVTAWDGYMTRRGTSPHFLVSGDCIPRHDVLNNCPYSYGLAEGDPLARPFVRRGTPGAVAFFSLEVAGNVAASYLAHKTGHHKIERVLSVVNIGISLRGASSWVGVK